MDESVAPTAGLGDDRVFNVDGELIPAGEASVDVRDRGFRYGDAAVEPVRVYGGKPFLWPAHFTRLARSCEALDIRPTIAESALESRVRETLSANELLDAYLEITVTGGVDSGGLNPDRTVDPLIIISAESMPRGGSNGRRPWGSPAALETVDVRRLPDRSIPTHVRTHDRLEGVLGFLDAEDFVDDVILLDEDGALTQTATASLFFVIDGTLYTSGADLAVHPGIRRWLVFEVAEEIGIPVETGRYSLEALARADEVFLANTRWSIRPVELIDGARYPEDRSVTDVIENAYDTLVDAQHY